MTKQGTDNKIGVMEINGEKVEYPYEVSNETAKKVADLVQAIHDQHCTGKGCREGDTEVEPGNHNGLMAATLDASMTITASFMLAKELSIGEAAKLFINHYIFVLETSHQKQMERLAEVVSEGLLKARLEQTRDQQAKC